MKNNIKFLTLAEVIEIHNDQIERYGGISGLRDLNLLSSAIAIPKTTFQKKYLHNNIFQMAAAYAYHICQNHPFLDGNKRVALVAALIFLDINGVEIIDHQNMLYETMMKVASGKANKDYIEKILTNLSNTN